MKTREEIKKEIAEYYIDKTDLELLQDMAYYDYPTVWLTEEEKLEKDVLEEYALYRSTVQWLVCQEGKTIEEAEAEANRLF